MSRVVRNISFTKKVYENISSWFSYFSKNINHYHESTNFIYGDMWSGNEDELSPEIKKNWRLQFNKLAPIANHLSGQQRQNTPNLEVVPTDSILTADQLKTIQALFYRVALHSDSKLAYQIAYQCSIIGGYGAIRVTHDYITPSAFNQHIYIESVSDPTLCFWDKGAVIPSKADGTFCGRIYYVDRKKFEKDYPRVKINNNEYIGNNTMMADENKVGVIEYFEREFYSETLVHIDDGNPGGKSIPKKDFDEMVDDYLDRGEVPPKVMSMRAATLCKIMHYEIAGEYILRKSEYPSDQLGIIFVDQNSFLTQDGQQVTRSFFSDAFDSQRSINYFGSRILYLMRMMRHDAFLGTSSMFKGHEEQWTDVRKVKGALMYNPDPMAPGQRPEQIRAPEISQSLLQQYQRNEMDIHSCLGVYDTQLGERGNEISGYAIDSRSRQGAANTYVTYDNLNRAIAQVGNTILSMIPFIYDSHRKVTLDDESDGIEIEINKPRDAYGKEIENEVVNVPLHCIVRPGPSYEGQKTEYFNAMRDLISISPEASGILLDLMAKNLPVANTREIVNRIQTLIPPEIIDAGKTGEPLPPKEPPLDPAAELAHKEGEARLKEADARMLNAIVKEQELKLKEAHLQLEAAKIRLEAMEKEVKLDQGQQKINIEKTDKLFS